MDRRKSARIQGTLSGSQHASSLEENGQGASAGIIEAQAGQTHAYRTSGRDSREYSPLAESPASRSTESLDATHFPNAENAMHIDSGMHGESISPAPSDSTHSATHVAALWDTLQGQERLVFLAEAVRRMAVPEALYTQTLLQTRLVADPLAQLPADLRERVLLAVESPLALVRMGLTCRSWRRHIFANARLWERVLQRHPGLRECIWPPENDVFPEARRLPQAVYQALSALKYDALLRRAWTRGECSWRVTFPAHSTGVITCLALDERRGLLLSGSDNGTVGVWDLRHGACVRMLSGHTGGIWAMTVVPGAGLVVSGSTDRTLIVWDVETGARLHDLTGHTSTVRCVEVISGRYIVSGSRDGTLRVWDLRRGCEFLHALLGHTASVRCITTLRPDNGPMGVESRGFVRRVPLVVSGSYDGTLRVWDVETGDCLSVCREDDNGVEAPRASGDSEANKVYAVAGVHDGRVFSGAVGARIRAWEPGSGALIAEFSRHSALVGMMCARRVDGFMGALLPDGLTMPDALLAAACTDGSLSMWDPESLSCVCHVTKAHAKSVTALDMNAYAVVTGSENAVRMWPLADLVKSGSRERSRPFGGMISGDISVSPPSASSSFATDSGVSLRRAYLSEANLHMDLEPIKLTDQPSAVWRIVTSRTHAAVAYQHSGASYIDVYCFAPADAPAGRAPVQ